MNSRERVITTLNHQIPDRVPIDLGGKVSGIHIFAYKRLLKHLGIKDDHIRIHDFIQQLVMPCEEVLQRFGIDTRYIYPPEILYEEDYDGEVVDNKYIGIYDDFGVFWGNFTRNSKEERLFYSPLIHPFEKFTTVEEIENYTWPDGKDVSKFKGFRKYVEKFGKDREYALVSPVLGNSFEYVTFLFGLGKAMRHTRKRPDLYVAAMKGLMKYWHDYATTFFQEVEDLVDIICVNGDLAGQSGPLFNPKFYVEHVKPLDHVFSKMVHKFPHIKVNYHCCGSTPEFLPHFIDVEYDSYNPVQISAFDMEPCSLKSRFGSKISFWGGAVNSQKTLPFGTPAEIAQEVEKNLKCFMPNGGYVASNIHNITSEVPAENITAMFDALLKFGKY
jgi:uroporphyrinogen decarboxylase